MPLAAITPLLPLLDSGILFIQSGTLRINQTMILEMPAEEHQATLRRLYLQLVRNDGNQEVINQMHRWAARAPRPEEASERRKFLGDLEAELHRIFRADPQVLENWKKAHTPVATPASPSVKVYPAFWDSLPRPVRIQLLRQAIEEKLGTGENAHATFLADRVADWISDPNERNLASVEALFDRLSRETPGTALHALFWDALFQNAEVTSRLFAWLQADARPTRNLLKRWLVGTTQYLQEPLSASPTEFKPSDRIRSSDALHPSWQQRFTREARSYLALMASHSIAPGTLAADETRHGRFLAQAFVAAARYPLSLEPETIPRSVTKMMDREMPILKQILEFVAAECSAEELPWPFLRGFWLKIGSELQAEQTKRVLQTLVMAIMIEDHRRSDIRKKKT